MSRYQQINSDYEIAYGNDHVTGMFVQVFKRFGPDEDEPLVDLNEMEHNVTVSEILDVAETYGFEINKNHLKRDYAI